jgi:hypothetical protein
MSHSVFKDVATRRQTSQSVRGQFGEKRLRVEQVLGVKAFGEPVVDLGEQLVRVLAFALALP